MAYGDLECFISTHPDVEQAVVKPDQEVANAMLKELLFHDAKDLERYLATYGWLAYKSVEFFGVGPDQDFRRSDMWQRTVQLRESWPMVDGYVVLENLGDGAYAMCDGHGRVFRFDCEIAELRDLHMQLENYILSRFLEVDKMQ